MQANQDPQRRRPVTPKPALGAAVLVIFLILHVVAIAIMRDAGTQDGAQASTLHSID